MIGVNWWRICNPTTPRGGKKLHEQASFSEKRQLEAQVWTTIMAILVRTCCCGCDLKTGILLIGILGVVSTLLTNDRTHSGQPQNVPKTRVVFTHNVWFSNAADIYLRHTAPAVLPVSFAYMRKAKHTIPPSLKIEVELEAISQAWRKR